MQLLFLGGWFQDEMIKALCWTLIHSLWQGLLAAALAGIIIITTRKAAASLRYNLLGSVLILFLLTTAITFIYQSNDIATKDLTAEANMQIATTSIFSNINEFSSVSGATMPEQIGNYFNKNADLFVLIWAVFFIIHCVKLLTGIAGVNHLRSRKVYLPGKPWQDKLNGLCKTLGIQQPVKLFQSELIKIPVAIGFFKPVILVPLGLLSNLPPEQVETILLHELAHIRRRDYAVNLLQRFIEAVFFFNPALIWISSLLRQEREACCDDVVVANTANKCSYLEALVSFQEYSLAGSGYAMAISHKRNYLLNRVKRILTRENKKLNLMEKLLLAVGLTVVTAFTFIPQGEIVVNKNLVNGQKNTPEDQAPPPTKAAAAQTTKPAVKKNNRIPVITRVLTDTVPVPQKTKEKASIDELRFPGISSNTNNDGKTKTQTTTATDQNGKTYTITKLNDKITSLTIDGSKIPDNEIDNYAPLFQKIDVTMQENKARRDQERVVRKKDMEVKKADMQKRREDTKERVQETKKRVAEQRKEREKGMEERQKMKQELANERSAKEKIKMRTEMESERKTKDKDKDDKIKNKGKEKRKIKTKPDGGELIKKDGTQNNNDDKNINIHTDVAVNMQEEKEWDIQNTKEIDLNNLTVIDEKINFQNRLELEKQVIKNADNKKEIKSQLIKKLDVKLNKNIDLKTIHDLKIKLDLKQITPTCPPVKDIKKPAKSPAEPTPVTRSRGYRPEYPKRRITT